MQHFSGRELSQRGVALALLMWMLAGMSLLVSAIVGQSRSDVQLTSLQLDQARAQAAALAGAHLALRNLYLQQSSGHQMPEAALRSNHHFAGYEMQVSLIPASGLVNLNTAPATILTILLQAAGGMGPDGAESLAASIVEWRGGGPVEGEGDYGGGPGRLHVEEQVLAVPGMTREVFEGIREYVHTQPSAGDLDLLSAPELLLNAWRSFDPDAVDFALKSRQDGARNLPGAPGATEPAAPFAITGRGPYCLVVDVNMGQGRIFRQRIWVDLGQGGAGLPWRFSRVYPVTLLPATSSEA